MSISGIWSPPQWIKQRKCVFILHTYMHLHMEIKDLIYIIYLQNHLCIRLNKRTSVCLLSLTAYKHAPSYTVVNQEEWHNICYCFCHFSVVGTDDLIAQKQASRLVFIPKCKNSLPLFSSSCISAFLQEAERAIQCLNGKLALSKKLVVRWAHAQVRVSTILT